jgi:hypothetical protein
MSAHKHFLIAAEAGIAIGSLSDIATALGAAFGHRGLLLTESDLSPEFFDLKTGLAGELFQKFTNYRLRLVFVVADPQRYGDRFTELAREHRAHDAIRIVRTREAADDWIDSLPPDSAS